MNITLSTYIQFQVRIYHFEFILTYLNTNIFSTSLTSTGLGSLAVN